MRSWRPVDGAAIAYCLAVMAITAMVRDRVDHPWLIVAAHGTLAFVVAVLADLQERYGGSFLTFCRSWDAALYVPVFVLLAGLLLPMLAADGVARELGQLDEWLGAAVIRRWFPQSPPESLNQAARIAVWAGAFLPAIPLMELFVRNRPMYWRAKTAAVVPVILGLLAAFAAPVRGGPAAFPGAPALLAFVALVLSFRRGVATRFFVIPAAAAAWVASLFLREAYLVGQIAGVLMALASSMLAVLWAPVPAAKPAEAPAPPAPAPAPEEAPPQTEGATTRVRKGHPYKPPQPEEPPAVSTTAATEVRPAPPPAPPPAPAPEPPPAPPEPPPPPAPAKPPPDPAKETSVQILHRKDRRAGLV